MIYLWCQNWVEQILLYMNAAAHFLRRLCLDEPFCFCDLGVSGVAGVGLDVEVFKLRSVDLRRASKGSTASCPITRSLPLEGTLLTTGLLIADFLPLFLADFEVGFGAVYSFSCLASTGVTPDCICKNQHGLNHVRTRHINPLKVSKFIYINITEFRDIK